MQTTIYDFHISFYIPAIKSLAFHRPHVRILVTNHCGELRCTAFKNRKCFQDVLCHCDYADMVSARFDHQIQSEYYVIYRYVSIEVFHCNILVHYQRLRSVQLHHHVNITQCFTPFYFIIANNMLPLILHTSSV